MFSSAQELHPCTWNCPADVAAVFTLICEADKGQLVKAAIESPVEGLPVDLA